MKNALPLIWRNIQERYNLMGSHCENCKVDFFPERKFCINCRRKGKIINKQMPHTGKIYSFTRVYAPPEGFQFEVPYYLAIIELDNKVQVLSQIVDVEEGQMKIGLNVKAVFRKIFEDGDEGVIAYGFKFAPKV